MAFDYKEQVGGFVTELAYTEQKVSADITRVGEKVGENLTDNQIKIIAAIQKNNRISFVELAKDVGIGENSIAKNVKRLEFLSRIGSARGGYWKVNI